MIADWLGLMEPARDENRPSGQRRGPAAPGEDKFPSPGQKSYCYLYNSNNPGTKTEIPRVNTAPLNVETPTQLTGC